MTTLARPDSVSVRVPAKINLELLVGRRRADGYHDLSTVFHAVSLFDEVTATPADDWSVSLAGPQTQGVPADGDNLALRAARLLARRAREAQGGHGADRIGPVHLHIDKEIPVAGGMAGGSADAAAALIACDALWGSAVGREELDACAAQLGSDVNFALTGGTAIGSGRGEQVTPVLAQGRYHWVLVPSEDGLSTGEVFAEHDRLRAQAAQREDAAQEATHHAAQVPGAGGADPVGGPALGRGPGGLRLVPDPDGAAAAERLGRRARGSGALHPGPDMMQALRGGDVTALAGALHNDLQAAALSLRPELGDVLAAGIEYGALGGVVSGSGPTVAFLVSGPEGALDLAVALMASGTASHVVRATGPAHGAHIVAEPRTR